MGYLFAAVMAFGLFGLVSWGGMAWVCRCTLKAGAIVRLAPNEDSPVYYACDTEEKYKRFKFYESQHYPGWLALKKGGYVQTDDLVSIGIGEYERRL